MRSMKRLAVAALMLLASCEQKTSKLDTGGAGGGGRGGAGLDEESELAISRIESRLAAIEAGQKMKFGPDGKTEAPLAERLQRVESSLVRYGEALEFLYKYYLQEKAKQDAQEANEPDPNATFAVDIGPAVRAGQVDGPNSATVTIVEAWDFA
jgi:hypothetical protein